MAKDIVTFLIRPSSSSHSSFFHSQRRYPIPREPLQRGRKIRRGGKILRFSIEVAVYLGNGTKQAHGYYGTLTGSHRRRIDTCRFR